MKRIIYIFLSLFLTSNLIYSQQESGKFLLDIEQNNTELRALKELIKSQKLENKTLNNLENPEVEVVHKVKRGMDPRNTELEITQGFDFPTAYKQRSNLIANLNEQEDINYRIKRKDILREARQLIVNYIFTKTQLTLIKERNVYAEQMFKGYEALFNEGQISILERNKTKLSFLESRKNLQLAEIELQSILNDLQRLNGGIAPETLPASYDLYSYPISFEDWYAAVKQYNPILLLAEKRQEMGKTSENLTRALNLPKLKAGYVAEIDPVQTRSGFLVSFSIPLWQGRNTIKAKKAQTAALQFEKQDLEVQQKDNMHLYYRRAVEFKKLLGEYEEVVDNTDSFELLKKSFELGRLDLIQYLQELMTYYEAVDAYLETEKEYQLALVELKQWEIE